MPGRSARLPSIMHLISIYKMPRFLKPRNTLSKLRMTTGDRARTRKHSSRRQSHRRADPKGGVCGECSISPVGCCPTGFRRCSRRVAHSSVGRYRETAITGGPRQAWNTLPEGSCRMKSGPQLTSLWFARRAQEGSRELPASASRNRYLVGARALTEPGCAAAFQATSARSETS